eukprot:scaffold108720_cov40-Attheya_sp.AAC.1
MQLIVQPAQPMLLKKSYKHIRENMYTTHGVLRARDITGAALNGQGLEVLRTVQTKSEKYYRGSLLPCSTDVDRCKKIVERFGKSVVPFKYEQTKFGEGIRFDIEKAIRAIIGAYGLTRAAKVYRICMAQATDGFQVTKRTTLMMRGVKMQDAGGVCPITITGLPTISEDPKDTTAQKRKESMKLHRRMGLYLRDCGNPATNPLTGFMPLDIAVKSDLSGTWKLLEMGGPFKVSRLPCINCAILSDDCHKPHSTRCSQWCEQLHTDREGWKCYHHKMNTPERVVLMQEEMLEVSQMLMRNWTKNNSRSEMISTSQDLLCRMSLHAQNLRSNIPVCLPPPPPLPQLLPPSATLLGRDRKITRFAISVE